MRRRLENRSKDEVKVTNNKRLEVRTSHWHVGLCLTFQEEERLFGDSIEREKQRARELVWKQFARKDSKSTNC